jgi:hypothetical protein
VPEYYQQMPQNGSHCFRLDVAADYTVTVRPVVQSLRDHEPSTSDAVYAVVRDRQYIPRFYLDEVLQLERQPVPDLEQPFR